VSQDNTADLWDIATRKHLLLFKHEDSIGCAAFSPDGTRIVTACSGNTARLWDVATGRQIALFRHDNGVVRAVFSLDGTRIVTASDDHTARLWDVATGQQLALFQHDNDVADAAFSPDGSRIVTASMDDTVRLWDTATGKRLALFRNDPIDTSASFGGMTIETASARFSPDGSKIIAARNNTARQWDAVSGDQLWTARNTVSASFSPDGAQVLTVAADHTARLFEAAAMHELALFEHGAMVRSAAFSPDGARIVTASNDYTARVWRAPGATTDELIKTARTEVQECLTAAQRKDVFLPERIPNWCYDMAKWPLRPLRWGISVADTVNKGDGKQWVRVIAVQPDLPAAVAGFKEGDMIVSANGEAIGDTKSFIAALASDKVRAGAETRIAIVRDEATLELKLKPRF
jgi:WD40 repeat protein